MSQFSVRLIVVICLLTAPVLQAESAGSLYNKGKEAEAAQKYETAYEFFKQAYDKNPKDLRYRTAYERTRFYAAAVKVHRGQILRDGGRLDDALAEFEAAAAVDPSMDIVQQEIRTTRRMIDEASHKPASPENEMLSQGPISSLLQEAQGPVELRPISDQPITLKITNDSRIIYETIGKLAGINVLFDPDYQSRRIQIELNGVSLQDALEIVAFESKTFWRPVTSNTIFIASDNPTKRKELEQNVIKTFYLSNVSQNTDLQDIVNTLRAVLQIDRVQQLVSQNAIVVRGTPDQMALAEKLIDDIDKPKPEVVVDVAIMQVNRDKIRDLGITPPSSVTVQLQGATTAAPATTTTTGSTSTSSTTPSSSGLTFNTFKHLGSGSYAVTAPQATASFLFSDSDSKVIQSPQLRAVNGGKATLKIGDRVPVATGSIGNPFSGTTGANGSFSGLVNTQFQYLDVGVNVEMTPTVHANREVTLKISLEISSVTSNVDIGGISQPIIGQRKIDHEIRLKEGEINILGGIFEDSDIKSWSGIPGLGKIPLFRYLFAKEHVERNVNEIVFVLIPHIVRMQEVTPLNRESLDIGNGTTVSLRHNSVKPQQPVQAPIQQPVQPQPQPSAAPQQAPAQPQQPMVQPSSQPVPQTANPPQGATATYTPGVGPPGAAEEMTPPATPAQPATSQVAGLQMPQGGQQSPDTQTITPPPTATQPGAQNPPSASPSTPASATASVRLDPPVITQAAGTTAAVNVMLDSAAPVHDFSMELKYDATAMQLVNVTNGGYLSSDNQPATVVRRAENGVVHAAVIRPPSAPGVPGQGAVLTFVFLLNKPGNYAISPASVIPKGLNGVLPVAVTGQTLVKVLNAPHP